MEKQVVGMIVTLVLTIAIKVVEVTLSGGTTK